MLTCKILNDIKMKILTQIPIQIPRKNPNTNFVALNLNTNWCCAHPQIVQPVLKSFEENISHYFYSPAIVLSTWLSCSFGGKKNLLGVFISWKPQSKLSWGHSSIWWWWWWLSLGLYSCVSYFKLLWYTV